MIKSRRCKSKDEEINNHPAFDDTLKKTLQEICDYNCEEKGEKE